jgi:SNF2 family DNA or RNA helicase
LIENGQANPTSAGVFLSYEQIDALSVEDAELFDSLASWSPFSIELSAFSAIGNPDFRLRTRFLLGDLEVDPIRVGAFLHLRGTVYRLPSASHQLLKLVEDLNRWPAEQKRNRRDVLLRWSEILALVGDVGAELDRYLSGERITTPERVHLDLHTDNAGRISVVPTFDDVPESSLHREYLRFQDIQEIYDLSDPQGTRLRVVIRPEVQQALDKVKRLRRLSGTDKDRVLSNPMLLLGDESEGGVADLLRFGPRVKGIGEYPAYVRAFTSSKERWTDLEPEEDKVQIIKAGLECTDYEGERKVLHFSNREEVQELLDKVQEAQNAQRPVVEYQDVQLPVGLGLIADLKKIIKEFSTEGEEKAGDRNPIKAPRTGVLIYTNQEREEYSEGTPNKNAPLEGGFALPFTLLPSVILKKHQEEGLSWLQRMFRQTSVKGVLLADDMGLGKTLQVLTFLAWVIEDALKLVEGHDSGPYKPILVVAPLILLDEAGWSGEMKRFFSSSHHFMPYQILHGRELSKLRKEKGTETDLSRPLLDIDAIRANRLVITNYETVANFALTFATIPWSLVIADEAHTFKDPDTKVSYTMKALKADFRVALTGTPVQNRLLDLWNLVDFLQPGPLLGSAREFEGSYEKKSGKEDRGKAVTEALRSRLRIGRHDAVLLRRTKEKHLPGLPKKSEHEIHCPLTKEQRELHVNFIQQASTNQKGGSAFMLLSSINKLCQHPALLDGGAVSASPATLVAASRKLRAVIDKLKEIRQRQEKALIFAWFRDAQEILKRVIESELNLDIHILNGQTRGVGSQMLAARTRMITEFEEKPGFNVLILSPEVAGVGLTIVKANHVLHYGRWWNPAVEDQATDRVYRIGQERDVEVYYFIATDPLERFKTFDEHLHSLINRKRRNAENFLAPQPNHETLQNELLHEVREAAKVVSETSTNLPSISTPQAVASLTPVEFEALVAAMLETEGYTAVLTPYSNDRGIDVVGIGATEILFVQCKHAQDGRTFDRAAIDEVVGGETYYTYNFFPSGLRGRGPRLMVAANSEADFQARRDAEQRGVTLTTGQSLLKRIANARVTRPVLDIVEGQRLRTLSDLQQRLLQVAEKNSRRAS